MTDNNYRWMPQIVVEDNKGSHEVLLMTSLLMRRKIFLEGEIDMQMANDFLRMMYYLNETKDPVDVIINSPGGMLEAGFMIIDSINLSELKVRTICAGRAMSMAALILVSGSKGERCILPNSKVIIHEPLIMSNGGGNASSIKELSDTLIEIRDKTNSFLASKTGKTLKEINKATTRDYCMNAREAVDFGICDRILDSL